MAREIVDVLLVLDSAAIAVLACLSKHPMTIGQMSRASGRGRTAVRNRIRTLETNGLARTHRRTPTRLHTITDAGRRTLRALRMA